MAPKGQRHRLIMYTYVLDHYWRATLGIGVVLLALVAAVAWLPSVLPDYTPPQIADRMLRLTGGVGVFAICVGVFLVILRKSAYVQPCANHLRLVTPFLRMNISYQRLIHASSADMGRLFLLEQLKGQKRAYLRPIAKQTAILLELKGWPLPRWALNLFLSPLFFPDKTARLALLVPDWIGFGNELESFRSVWSDSLHRPASTPQSDLLASLAEKR